LQKSAHTPATATEKSTLQLADIVASSIYSAVEPTQGFISSHGISMYPIIYKDNNLNLLGSGINFNDGCNKNKILAIYPWLDKEKAKYIHDIIFPIRPKEIKLSS
jgi:hypothetical protein